MTTSNPVDLTPDFAEQTAEHDQTQAAIAAESGNVQTLVTNQHTTTKGVVTTESGNVQTLVTNQHTATQSVVTAESGNVQTLVTNQHTTTKGVVTAESAVIQAHIDAQPKPLTREVIRGRTILGMGVSSDTVDVVVANPSMAEFRFNGYRNNVYSTFKGEAYFDEANSRIQFICDATNVQVNSGIFNWELTTYV